MTVDDFVLLVEKKSVPAVRDALFELVRAWRHHHQVRLVMWPELGRWFAWVEYGDKHDLGGYSAVDGVRGEGADADSAVRDCAIRWFVFIDKTDRERDARVKDVCLDLGRAFDRRFEADFPKKAASR